MEIRKATLTDLPDIMAVYETARSFMAQHGNPSQWGKTDPTQEKITEDIQNQSFYVCEEQGRIEGVFYYHQGPDATYREIRGGSWLNDRPYAVVHRIASAGRHKGVGSFCLEQAFARCGNLRIDTHEDNQVMQSLLMKLGFQRCGTVTVENGTDRIAFQKCEEK